MKQQQEAIAAATKGKGGHALESSENVKVPAKYGDPEKSGLQVDVTGGRQTFDIKLD